jgi:hypothetical protein
MYKLNSSSPEDIHRLAHEAHRVGIPHLSATSRMIAAITALDDDDGLHRAPLVRDADGKAVGVADLEGGGEGRT